MMQHRNQSRQSIKATIPAIIVYHTLPLDKGVALQHILYSDRRPQSRRKSKVKVGFW